MLLRANHLETTKLLNGVDVYLTTNDIKVLIQALKDQVVAAAHGYAEPPSAEAEKLFLAFEDHLKAHQPNILTEKLEILE